MPLGEPITLPWEARRRAATVPPVARLCALRGEMLLRPYRRSRHAAPGPCRPTPLYPQHIKGFA